ncbi:regulatory protein, luxR family [Lutibacter oricola]|uniref:Regulatory protein, luxR family n=1 Tax=Lutibacter oricola TaxID=762486 RepID=A0A1H3CYX9_9FLAO|nr:LuxR C-terminal-related transcriptional regulator [Lutibacter oricola]SDX59335.1 regulatory protein, luxR family [Lutibacter oricola]
MQVYNVDKMFEVYNESDLSRKIDLNDYNNWIKFYVDIVKPDLIAILNIKDFSPILYSKNFNLEFAEGDEETIEKFLEKIEPSHLEKMVEADQHVISFSLKNKIVPRREVLKVVFNAELKKGVKKTFERSVMVLTEDVNKIPELVVTSITDVSDIYGMLPYPKNTIVANGELDDTVKRLKTELDEILTPELKLTKRERQILGLIAKGETSSAIANILNISPKTVNTHRQNLIKKHGVKNTASLINLI